MKTYRNEQLGFEIDIPEQWSFRTSDQISRSPGKNHSLIFHCRSNEAFNFQISALTPEPVLSHTENEFRQYAQDNGYTNLGLGRFKVNDKEQVWARYYVGYGQWAKKYKIILYGTEYIITATCLEQKLLLEMEKAWDEVAASFRLLRSANKTDDPKNELGEQKGGIPDKHGTESGNIESQVTAHDKSAGVKAYRNEQYNFEMDIPQEWSLSTVPVNDGLKFVCTHNEAFNFQIGPIIPEPIPEHTEREFKIYAQHNGLTNLQFGRISVEGRDHVWARYQMENGVWAKKYMVVLGGIEYAITATATNHTTFSRREKVWDAAVSSIRLIGLSEWLAEGIKAHRVEVGGDLYELAYEAVAIGDYSKARPLLEKCLGDNPDHVLAHKELALILKKTGDLQGALFHRREVKRLDPSDTINLYNLADLLAGLGEKEEAWQVIKELQALDPNNPELQRFTNIKDKPETPDNSKTSPPTAKDVHKADKEISEAGNNQEKQHTLVFSIISYALIAAIAFLYIHSKVTINTLFSLSGEISQSLSKSEYNIVVLVLMYGIGALVCLLFLLGVVLNRQDASTFFNFIERTMRERHQQQETLGAILFSDYTRSPNGVLDVLRLQFTNLIRVLFKIIMIFFSVGLLPPAMSLVVAILLFGPQFILHHPVPIPWQAGITLLWFYLCYRAMVFWLARMKGIARLGDQPVENHNASTLPSQQESKEKHLQAAFHMLQGISLTESRQGQRAENLEKAIYHFQQALTGFTRQDQPSDWASAQNALGEAYRNLSLLGDREKNLDQAIFHYQQALEVATRQTDPDLWAAVHNNLGIAYANGASGDQAENVEQAIRHCQQALEVYTRNLLPDDWAMTQNNLGNAYNKRLHGERADNIERAISCFQQALEVQSHQTEREQWAGTQTNLAQAYWVRIRGERTENLEQVIMHDQQALEVYKRETYPQDWAITHNRLGAVYQIRMRGDPAENLEQAIHHTELALTIYSRQSTPKHWAEAQNYLALAFQGRRRGERAENIEKAISLFQQALQVYTRRDFPLDWAVTQNYLAFAYEDRVRGNRADNIEQAIGYFQQALKVFTRQTYPEQWAHTHTPLASAYEMRKIGKRDENLDQAARHYQQALEVHTRQDYPEQWAMGQIFLGITCMERKRGKPAEYTAQAIHYYQQAQQVFTRDKYPEEWARIQEGLAAAHNEANPVGLSYPQFYNQESQQQPGQKRTLKLAGSIIPDFPYFIHLLLLYQWDEKLPDDEANRLAKRAIAYISCAIYDAARDAGWPCQASPIPNGRRPAWILDGERSPVSLTLSDIDLSERSCQLTIGAIITVMGKPPANRARWEKLHAAFKARFSEITV